MPKLNPKRSTSESRRLAERDRLGIGTATLDRLQKAGADGYEYAANNVQRITEAPLDMMFRREQLDQREWQAGDDYRELAHRALVEPSPGSVDLNRVGGFASVGIPSMFLSQSVSDARQKWRRLEAVVPKRVWVVLYAGLVLERSLTQLGWLVSGERLDVVASRRDAVEQGKAGLKMALGVLADLRESGGAVL